MSPFFKVLATPRLTVRVKGMPTMLVVTEPYSVTGVLTAQIIKWLGRIRLTFPQFNMLD
jgi:hypothetical protein